MKNIQYVFILLFLLLFTACKENKIENDFQITDIINVPNEIDGCSSIFSENEKKHENGEYLFVSNLDSIAFISVNNKIIRLRLMDRKFKPNTTGDKDYYCQYSGENYKVFIEINRDDTKQFVDESWWDKGTITIENKDGIKLVKSFIGESGC